MASRPRPCARCQSGAVVPIVYGLPRAELMEAARRSDVEIGLHRGSAGVGGLRSVHGRRRLLHEVIAHGDLSSGDIADEVGAPIATLAEVLTERPRGASTTGESSRTECGWHLPGGGQ